MKKQLILAVSMVFLVLAVCSAAAAAEVSDGTQIQVQNQTVSQVTNYNSTNINSVQTSTTNTNSYQSNTINTALEQPSNQSLTDTNSAQMDTTEQPLNQNSADTDSAQTNVTEQPSNVMISGQVTKCSTGEPFPGVTVTARKDGVPIASTTTKEDGTYTLEFQSDDGVFNVTASYPGHEPSSKEVTVNPDSNGTLQGKADFQLGLDDVYVSPTGSDSTGDGTQANPYQTIGKGINEVNAGGTVHLADGTYNLPNDIGLTINKDVTIVGQSQAGTIIDAGGTSSIFFIPSGNTVTLQNLTLKKGTSLRGGAIFNDGNLTVNNCTFTNNSTLDHDHEGDGGAIYNSGGTLNVTGSTFTNNTAGGSGGAIGNYGSGTLNVTNCTFTNNTAYVGGAIYNYGDLTVNDSDFTNNTAYGGGAILNDGDLTVNDSDFTNNTAHVHGGAIFNVGGDATSRHFNFNRIVGNNPSNSEVYSQFGTMDATLNWWGSNLSPAGKVSTAFGGVVLFDPWLVLTVTANPTTIYNGGTSQVTADLQHDSNGVYHDPALGHVPDGIPITLTTNWGSFTNPVITHSITLDTVNGSVTATFFANEGPTPQPPLNPVEITATADDETVSTFILILEPPITINIGNNASILNPSQSQSQSQAQTQTQISNNTNTNNLTNNNFNALSNVNTFNPVISLVNLNGVGVN